MDKTANHDNARSVPDVMRALEGSLILTRRGWGLFVGLQRKGGQVHYLLQTIDLGGAPHSPPRVWPAKPDDIISVVAYGNGKRRGC